MRNHEEQSWQARKSETTRNRIMEAAINCFVTLGYTNTTITNIADEATLSRGAMMHHFESRLDVIKSAISYLVDKRLQEFETHLESISDPDNRDVVNSESLKATVNSLWDYFRLPSFYAFQELLITSRTDAELGDIVNAAQQRLDLGVSDAIGNYFPIWSDKKSALTLINDLFHFALQGMAMSDMLKQDEERTINLLNLLIENGISQFKQAEILGRFPDQNH